MLVIPVTIIIANRYFFVKIDCVQKRECERACILAIDRTLRLTRVSAFYYE